MAQKKTQKRRSKASRAKTAKPSWKRRLFTTLLKLSLVLVVIAGIGLVYLDQQVRHKFEGKRWALPAKVYARPLELYPGRELSASDFKAELAGLGYRSVSRAQRPGTVHWQGQRAVLVTRSFNFPDGAEPSRVLRLSFGNGHLQQMTDGAGKVEPLVRLEPIVIGGIYPQNHEDRDLVKIGDVPAYLPKALVSVEDRHFYEHHGVSLRGISRAMVVNIKAGRFVQGGSTLTQQLIKNFYLTSERTLARKLMEIPMAMLLELHYSKDEILQAYLNEVYLGQSGSRAIHGFGLAARYYFGSPISEIDLAQAATLAGLVRGPSYYDPRRYPERALNRRNLVLRLMRDQNYISETQYAKAKAEPLGVVAAKSVQKGAYPAYLDLVRRQLREEYKPEDLSSEGLRIFTALDPLAQKHAYDAVSSTLNKLHHRYGKRAAKLQSAMVVTDPQTGEIMAIVGGRHTRFRGFNRALDSRRSVGSTIKPFVYLTALENGYTLASHIKDEPFKLKLPNGDVWSPNNFERKSFGEVPLHYALAHSLNIATARLGLEVGVKKVIDMVHRAGMERDLKPYPSELLGAQGMSPLEVAQIYQTLAANGFKMPLRAIRSVTDADGKELSRYSFDVKQTISPDLVHLIQYAMQEVVREGTGRYAYSVLPNDLNISGKTGTSNDQRDSWFSGFTGNRLAIVWVGRDDNAHLPFTGAGGALRVWTDFMRRDYPQPFMATHPQNINYVWIDDESGKRSAEDCEGARQIPFIRGTAPTENASCVSTGHGPLDWFRRWFR